MKKLLVISWAMLAACSKAAAPAVSAPAAAPVTYETSQTVDHLMDYVVQPTALSLWSRVREEASAKGVEQFYPRTDAEWVAAAGEASILVEAGNMLRLPERTKQWQADEADKDWDRFAADLSAKAMAMQKAAMAKSPEGLFDAGMELDAVCDSCHDKYVRGETK